MVTKRKKAVTKRKKAVLVDLDGTVVRVTKYNPPEGEAALAEYLAGWDDLTLASEGLDVGIEMVKKYKTEGYAIVVVTARHQERKKATAKKMRMIGLDGVIDSMWHRPNAMKSMSSSEYKRVMIRRLSRRYDFIVAMDDEEKNLVMMREEGIETVIDARTWW